MDILEEKGEIEVGHGAQVRPLEELPSKANTE